MNPPDLTGGIRYPRQYGLIKRGLVRIFARGMRFFFYLIYQPMACTYDLVAWSVSLGRWKDWVLSVLPYLDEQPILELGHGPGYLQAALAEEGLKVFGVDFSRQMGTLARHRLERLGHAQLLARGRAQVLPFRSTAFMCVVTTFPSEYIFHPDTLAEARRVLAPGGQLVVAPLAWITGNSILDRAARWLFRITGEAPEWLETWLQPFLEAGFVLHEQQFIELRNSRVLVLVFDVSFNLG